MSVPFFEGDEQSISNLPARLKSITNLTGISDSTLKVHFKLRDTARRKHTDRVGAHDTRRRGDVVARCGGQGLAWRIPTRKSGRVPDLRL